MPPKRIYVIVILSILVKLIYFGFALLVNPSVEERFRTSANLKGFESVFDKNDAGWYKKICIEGYPKITNKVAIGFSYKKVFVQSAWAFFPCYPFLNRIIMNLLSCRYSTSAMILSLIFSALAFVGFFKFCLALSKNENEAFFLTILFMVLPFNYYFSVFYTESLFFTFLIYSFLAIHHKRTWLLLLYLIPLVLLRPNGLIACLPLALYYLERNDVIKGSKFDLKQLAKHWYVVFYFATALIAFVAFGFYQEKMTGEFFAFSIAQTGWYREFMFPILALFRRGDFATQFNSFYTIIVMLFAIFAWKRFSLSLNILIWASIVFPMCSGSITSMQRYITVIFPLTIFLGELILKAKRPYYILPVVFMLQLFVFYFWIIEATFSF